tara:strand:- start:1010 stop:1261 length:252 start_codon:yes stop_codon:yes gene_type:complete
MFDPGIYTGEFKKACMACDKKKLENKPPLGLRPEYVVNNSRAVEIIITVFISSMVFIGMFSLLIKVLVAQKVFLLEYLQRLVG